MRGRPALFAIALVAVAVGAAPGGVSPVTPSQAPEHQIQAASGLSKLNHLIFIVQENRSFDQYFGTYPGADGIPRWPNGKFKVCIPDKALGHCVRPFHDTSQYEAGGNHGVPGFKADYNHGEMNGFVNEVLTDGNKCTRAPNLPQCKRTLKGPSGQPDVMGFENRSDIPNYWAYADHYLLQDRMFAPTDGWTLPSHLFLVSAWSAACKNLKDPMSCHSDLIHPGGAKAYDAASRAPRPYAWTDITWLLHKYGVSWGYYVGDDTCVKAPCKQTGADVTIPFQNPLPGFRDVAADFQLRDVMTHSDFFRQAQAGTLPSVSWVMASVGSSEHPPYPIGPGQAWVTDVVNAVMKSPDWSSSAIFLTWDDWGGFYDNVKPPKVDANGYGLRTPGLVISPWVKPGVIDHQVLSFDAYLRLIEARFLNGQALDPRTDGRPDSRPTVREHAKILGHLINEFDFTQRPNPPLILPPHP
jgi:phospholipase C